MQDQFTYYDLLGVAPNAPYEEIRNAYRSVMAAYHPDVNKARNAAQLAEHINKAWEVLRDPQRRSQYDNSITKRPYYATHDAYDRSTPNPTAGNVGTKTGSSSLSTWVVRGIVSVVIGIPVVVLFVHLLPFVLLAGLSFVVLRWLFR